MKIDLLIDASASPPADSAVRRATLERFIARGDLIACEATDLESSLRWLFDLPRDRALPVAAASLIGDGLDPGSDDWLRLDPVHLRADRSRLLLVLVPADDVTADESRSVLATLGPHFAQSGYELLGTDSRRWYLRAPRLLDVRTQPPSACVGPLDERHLPAGSDGAQLRRLVTEAQMLLHELPMNEAREAAGKLPVTGVWPWGNGPMPAIAASRYTHVVSDDPLVRGIAHASGARTTTLPADAQSLASATWRHAAASGSPGDSAASLDSRLRGNNVPENVAEGLPQISANASLLVTCSVPEMALAQIEQTWMTPLAASMQAGEVAELRFFLLRANGCLARRVTPRNMRRWWRRARPLAHA